MHLHLYEMSVMNMPVCCLYKCFNACFSSVNIQSSIWLGPSRVCLVWIGLALQAARGLTLPEASSPPTAT